MASRVAGRAHSVDPSTMVMMCLTAARKADMRWMSAGSTSTERICPYCVGNCSKRQDRPDRSGRAPGGCARDAYFVTLHRRIRPRNSAAREHCDADIVRNGVPSDADIVAVSPDLSDGYHPYPQCEVEILADPGRGFRKSLPGYSSVGGRNSKARPVTAKYERKIPATDGIGDRSDHGRSGHVHRLVAVVLNSLCRLLDIGDANEPVIR